MISVFALLAAVASLGSVAVLINGGRAAGAGETYALVLAGASMLCTWVFVQLVFTVHYAHVYYGTEDGRERGGLDFHGEEEPDFWDFLYFAMTIAAAAASRLSSGTAPSSPSPRSAPASWIGVLMKPG